jgi:hypothetical protein
MLRGEILAGAQERGEDTYQRTLTRAREGCPRLRARGKQEAPTRQDSRVAASTAQRGSAAAN